MINRCTYNETYGILFKFCHALLKKLMFFIFFIQISLNYQFDQKIFEKNDIKMCMFLYHSFRIFFDQIDNLMKSDLKIFEKNDIKMCMFL